MSKRRSRFGGGDDDGDGDGDPGDGSPYPSETAGSPREPPPQNPWDRGRNNFAGWVWEQLDEVSLREVFAQDVVTTIDPPLVIRQDYIHLQGYALQRFYDTHNDENFTERDQERALKLHLLLSRMLLERIEEHGEEGKAFFQARVRRLYRGDWLGLLRDAQHRAATRPAQN